MFGDDSTLLVDAVSGVHYGALVGDVTGSVFADDSGVIIDGINAKVVGMIDTTSLRTSESAIALGKNAGKTSHGTRAIAIGEDAGETSQGGNAISIGTDAGKTSQGSASIAIGASAGLTGQSVNSIAIGASAGTTNLAQNSIIINATGGAVENTVNASLVVKPIRAASNANFLKYNVGTGEITYEADAAGVFTGDLTGSVFADNSTLLVDGVNARLSFSNNVLADLSNVSGNAPSVGQVLKWDGSQWAPALDATSGGGGLDADTLNGQNGAYYLAWSNFSGTPTTVAGYGITDAVTATSTTTFTNKSLTKAQVTDLLTSDFNVGTNKILYSNVYATEGDLPNASTYHGMFAHVHATGAGYFAHGGAWTKLANNATTLAGYGITDGYVNTDVDTHLNQDGTVSSGEVLSWNGSDYAWVAQSGGGGGLANVVEDTTPQLGGDLDCQGFNITMNNGSISTTAGNLQLSSFNYITMDSANNGQIEIGKSSGLGDVIIGNESNGTSVTLQGVTSLDERALFYKGAEEKYSVLTGATGTVAHDCANGKMFHHTTPAADWTVNLTNLDLNQYKFSTSVGIVVTQGNTAYIPNAVQIAGAAQTIIWQGNSTPTGTANGTDAVSFTIMRDGSTYIVLGQLTSFGGV